MRYCRDSATRLWADRSFQTCKAAPPCRPGLSSGVPSLGGDDGARTTVAQNVNESLVSKLDIQRHSHGARANDSQRSHDPFRAIFREQRNGIAAFETIPDEPVRERSRAVCKLFKRPAMSIFFCQSQQCCLFAALA